MGVVSYMYVYEQASCFVPPFVRKVAGQGKSVGRFSHNWSTLRSMPFFAQLQLNVWFISVCCSCLACFALSTCRATDPPLSRFPLLGMLYPTMNLTSRKMPESMQLFP